MRKKKIYILSVLILLMLATIFTYTYIKMNPLVFNESFFQHAHCMAAVWVRLGGYASEHTDNFPLSDKGYADALAMIGEGTWMLTGPGYTSQINEEHKKNDIPENLCGRVYVQGLNIKNDWNIAILFDKKATPGADHCHLFARIFSPLGREVQMLSGEKKFISQSQWPSFASQQIELLVKAGFSKEKAQWHYNQIDK